MHLTVLGLEQKFPQIAQKISKNKNKFSGLNFLVIVNNFCSRKMAACCHVKDNFLEIKCAFQFITRH